MIKATLAVLALTALAACDTMGPATGLSDPLAGDVSTGGSLGSHPPNAQRAGSAP